MADFRGLHAKSYSVRSPPTSLDGLYLLMITKVDYDDMMMVKMRKMKVDFNL